MTPTVVVPVIAFVAKRSSNAGNRRDPDVAVALVRSGAGRQTNAIVRTAALGDAVLADCRAWGTGSAFVLVPRQNLDPSVAELATGAIPAAGGTRPGVTGFVRKGHIVVPFDAPGSGDRSCGPIGLQLATPVTAPWPGSDPRV